MKLAYNRYYLSINLFLFLPSLFLGFSSVSFISRLGKLSGDRDGSASGKAPGSYTVGRTLGLGCVLHLSQSLRV